jgi:hypothetical protein
MQLFVERKTKACTLAAAQLNFAAQNPLTDPRRVYADDAVSFNWWHMLQEHKSLGSIMCARRPA